MPETRTMHRRRKVNIPGGGGGGAEKCNLGGGGHAFIGYDRLRFSVIPPHVQSVEKLECVQKNFFAHCSLLEEGHLPECDGKF